MRITFLLVSLASPDICSLLYLFARKRNSWKTADCDSLVKPLKRDSFDRKKNKMDKAETRHRWENVGVYACRNGFYQVCITHRGQRRFYNHPSWIRTVKPGLTTPESEHPALLLTPGLWRSFHNQKVRSATVSSHPLQRNRIRGVTGNIAFFVAITVWFSIL